MEHRPLEAFLSPSANNALRNSLENLHHHSPALHPGAQGAHDSTWRMMSAWHGMFLPALKLLPACSPFCMPLTWQKKLVTESVSQFNT